MKIAHMHCSWSGQERRSALPALGKLALATIPLVMSACASSPGIKMDESRLRVHTENQQAQAADNQVYDVIPITASVLAQQKPSRIAPAAESSTALSDALSKYKYRVHPQDVLNITVYDHPELTSPAGQYRNAEESGITVGNDGTIYFPFAGTLRVSSHTLDEIRHMMVQRLATYIRNPQVDIRIASYRSQKINVVGEVKKPGIEPITDVPMTIMEAINRADGPTLEADMQNVTLTRDGITRTIDLQEMYNKGDASKNLLLKNGDLVTVPDRSQNKVFVMGEVKKQAAYQMHKGRMTLAEAIGGAEGLDPLGADPRKIYVIRKPSGKPLIYRLNGNAPDALLLASEFQMQPHDIVFVSTSEVSRWGRTLGQILPSIGSLSGYRP